jgi:hypothetical protein
MEGVKTRLSSQAEDFFDRGIKKLIPLDKFLNSGGNCVEKQLKYLHTFYIINIFFLIAYFVNSSPEVPFRISLVLGMGGGRAFHTLLLRNRVSFTFVVLSFRIEENL